MAAPRSFSVLSTCGNIFLVLVVYTIYERIRHSGHVQRGFFCADQSLKYPYRNDVVGWKPLKIWGYVVTAILILIGDAFLVPARGESLLARILRAGNVYLVFLFGLFSTLLISEWIKKSTGRPRPHFFEVCRPSYDGKACLRGDFIQDYTCQGNPDLFPDPHQRLDKLRESEESFASGHACHVLGVVTFLLIYLNSRLLWRRFPAANLLLLGLQVGLVCFALHVSISRVVDHHHFASDILAGALLGIGIQSYLAYVTQGYLAPNYDELCQEEVEGEEAEHLRLVETHALPPRYSDWR